MMPLITRRSSTRATPRILFGSNGRSRSNCSLLNQNSLKSRLLLLPSLNHIRAAKGIPFMGPDPSKIMKDGWPGFVLEARGFDYSSECNACTRGTPLVLTVRDGRSIDISSDAAVRPLFAHDLPARRRVCLSEDHDRNGSCAAFVADAARLGQAASAWRVMLAHYRHEPAGYPAALRSFLVAEGYLTSAAASALPLT